MACIHTQIASTHLGLPLQLQRAPPLLRRWHRSAQLPRCKYCTSQRQRSLWERQHLHALWPTVLGLLHPGDAAAAAGAAYDPSAGEEVFKNVAGAAYVLLLAVFCVRLFRKRALFGTTQRLASLRGEEEEDALASEEAGTSQGGATALDAIWGAVQTGFMSVVMYKVSTSVEGYFGGQALPDQYTVRNITVALRTTVQGMSYLATFIFAANTIGLTGLSLQLLLNGIGEADTREKLD